MVVLSEEDPALFYCYLTSLLPLLLPIVHNKSIFLSLFFLDHNNITKKVPNIIVSISIIMRLVLWTGLLLVQISFASAATCERLQQSLTYTQEEAPRDLSGVVRREKGIMSRSLSPPPPAPLSFQKRST